MAIRLSSIALALTLLLGTLIVAPPAAANTVAGRPIYFSETGHTLAYNFREFFERQGGLPILGLPLSEVYIEDSRPVQYFERARLEWHADLMQVQAGHLGRWAAEPLVAAQHPAFVPAAPREGASYSAATRHNLSGAFAQFWQASGGLATFGHPLSEEFNQVSPDDGNSYLVQYFERARFEFHPELPPAYQVSLSHLGRRYLAEHPAPAEALAPVAGADAAWSALRPSHLRIARIGVDTPVEEIGFSADEWDVPRYTAGHYWPVSAVPGTPGNIVIAGHVGYRGIIFNQLPSVAQGDAIELTVGGAVRSYQVQEVLTLLPTETWVMDPTPSETLTLITCVPIGVYSHRLIVRATPL